MPAIGSLNGSPQTAPAPTTSKTPAPADTSVAAKEKVKEKETATAPPPEPARLDSSTGYNLVRVLQETTPAEPEAAPETEAAAKAAKPEPGPVLDGSEAALRLMQDTVRELETRRAEDAERRLAADEEVEEERPAERERLERAPAEKDEARRDDLFQQRAAARGVNLYQTSLDPREEAGAELNARF